MEQVQDAATRGSDALEEALFRDARVQPRCMQKALRCRNSTRLRACAWSRSPRVALCSGALFPPKAHLFHEHVARTVFHLLSAHMSQICSSGGGIPISGSTQRAQSAPLRCTARCGCSGARTACRSTSTHFPQLSCDSMQRCFQLCVFTLQGCPRVNDHSLQRGFLPKCAARQTCAPS